MLFPSPFGENMACSCKLVVEVVRANGLTDGVDVPNLCVELCLGKQRFKTSVKERVSNPVWNESFYFSVSSKDTLSGLSLEANVYNVAELTHSESLLGKVRLPGTSFADSYDEVVTCLRQKKNYFTSKKNEFYVKKKVVTCHPLRSWITKLSGPKGELLLKVFIKNENEQLADENHETLDLRSAVNHFTALSQGTQESRRPVVDFQLIEINPPLGGGRIVEHMPYIFVCVVKAQGLPDMDATGSLNPYVEVKFCAYEGITEYMKKEQNPEWNTTFAFSKLHNQIYKIHVVVKNKDKVRDDFVGKLSFDLRGIKERLPVPARPPVQPRWHQLLDMNGNETEGELMLAIWEGSQADEAYPVARMSDSLNLDVSVLPHIRPQVYYSPILWCVRVHVMKLEGIAMEHETQIKQVYVTASVRDQLWMIRIKDVKQEADYSGEEPMFVAAEPLESELKIYVKERLWRGQDKIIGQIAIPLASLDKIFDGEPIKTKSFQLERPPEADEDEDELIMPFGTIYLKNWLDGGYIVLDDSQIHVVDTRATDNQTSQNPLIGSLELGILKANILHTRDAKSTSNPYCVAKYGGKLVRTRTVINRDVPVFNEQYTWDVFDTATILTVGVFDNGQLVEERSNINRRDTMIGKVRILLSCLQRGRIYALSYPLLVLFPWGLEKTGELHLSVRFSLKTSTLNLLHMYSRPILPEMHYTHPITIEQREMMRNFMAARMSQMEPPLRKEVVLHMYDESSSHFSLRKSKANFFRLMQVISPVITLCRWFELVCSWRNPVTSFLVLVIFILAVIFHELILPLIPPLIPLFIIFIVMANYRWRPRYPPHLDSRISHANVALPDELDEEFDAFPTSRSDELVRMRYDRLRSVAGRIQTVLGDLGLQGERIQALVSWRDRTATAIFELFTLAAAAVLYYVPYRYLVGIAGVYTIMAPLFRRRTPSFVVNFFRRLPHKADMLI